ncbi:hypothetical protein [Sphingobacterium hotanense]|uniref:hypothetical protein n=1 Tax=Sphingobacterium hotanense TaxID=649196 RepID=UPI0011F368D6|nr:hypothetical protein [Sphingobacterium hotanense]
MGLLKKLGKQKKPTPTVGSITEKFILIDELKSKKLLETTSNGIFYIYPEVLRINKNPNNFFKNLYVYGRSTGLLRKGEVLQIRNQNDSAMLASLTADEITLYK